MAEKNDTDRVLDELLKGKAPEEILGDEGVLKQLTKRLVERALEGEMTTHLGYEKNSPSGKNSGNSRNGKTTKQVNADFGSVELAIPRGCVSSGRRSGNDHESLVKVSTNLLTSSR